MYIIMYVEIKSIYISNSIIITHPGVQTNRCSVPRLIVHFAPLFHCSSATVPVSQRLLLLFSVEFLRSHEMWTTEQVSCPICKDCKANWILQTVQQVGENRSTSDLFSFAQLLKQRGFAMTLQMDDNRKYKPSAAGPKSIDFAVQWICGSQI